MDQTHEEEPQDVNRKISERIDRMKELILADLNESEQKLRSEFDQEKKRYEGKIQKKDTIFKNFVEQFKNYKDAHDKLEKEAKEREENITNENEALKDEITRKEAEIEECHNCLENLEREKSKIDEKLNQEKDKNSRNLRYLVQKDQELHDLRQQLMNDDRPSTSASNQQVHTSQSTETTQDNKSFMKAFRMMEKNYQTEKSRNLYLERRIRFYKEQRKDANKGFKNQSFSNICHLCGHSVPCMLLSMKEHIRKDHHIDRISRHIFKSCFPGVGEWCRCDRFYMKSMQSHHVKSNHSDVEYKCGVDECEFSGTMAKVEEHIQKNHTDMNAKHAALCQLISHCFDPKFSSKAGRLARKINPERSRRRSGKANERSILEISLDELLVTRENIRNELFDADASGTSRQASTDDPRIEPVAQESFENNEEDQQEETMHEDYDHEVEEETDDRRDPWKDPYEELSEVSDGNHDADDTNMPVFMRSGQHVNRAFNPTQTSEGPKNAVITDPNPSKDPLNISEPRRLSGHVSTTSARSSRPSEHRQDSSKPSERRQDSRAYDPRHREDRLHHSHSQGREYVRGHKRRSQEQPNEPSDNKRRHKEFKFEDLSQHRQENLTKFVNKLENEKFCRFFQNNRWCRYEGSCRHVHDQYSMTDGLSKLIRLHNERNMASNSERSQPQERYRTNNPGQYTEVEIQTVLNQAEQSRFCWHFDKKGKCLNGVSCRNIHDGNQITIGLEDAIRDLRNGRL